MPFINPWTTMGRSSPVPDSKQQQGSESEKYQFVEDILNAPDYYQVLGVTKDASPEEVRRAYIRRSRVCHPDKFVPPYPRATESFQILSLAYETLSNPSSKLMYDLSKPQHPMASFSSKEDENPNDTLQRVLHQLFIEMLDGEFQTMRAFIHALNDTNPGMRISDEAVSQIEEAFQKMRQLFVSTHSYYKVVQFELMRLYELQQELRRLSYFDLWRRMGLSITICKVLLQVPIMINAASREKHQEEQRNREESASETDEEQKLLDKSDEQGILGARVENALKLAVSLLETGERYATGWK